MRFPAAFLMTAAMLAAQFKSTAPLVVAPTTITDAKGRFVDGIEQHDLVLFDNNVPQPIQLDFETYPISLVVAVQTSQNAEPVLDKLGRSGELFTRLLAGEAGETALLTFSNDVQLQQDFTADAGELTKSLRGLKVEGDGGVTLDALMESLRILRARPANHRRVILVVAERRVKTATVKLQDVVQEVERQNAQVYWLTFSPSLAAFTARPKKVDCDRWGKNCGIAPPSTGGMDLLAGLAALYHLNSPDVSELFTKATGARTIQFLRRSGLEDAIQAVGTEVHRQYIVTYQPAPSEPGRFHALRLAVKGRPELQVRTRAGYWTVQ